MWEPRTPTERALVLAAVTGLKLTYGPTLLASSSRRPGAGYLAVASIGELVLDKLGVLPSRSRLPLLIPRALAGAWVAREVAKAQGGNAAWAAPMGAAVAAGTALLAPTLRGAVQRHLGVPDPLLGLAEDWIAVGLGSRAVGMPTEELAARAGQSIGEARRQAAGAL